VEHPQASGPTGPMTVVSALVAASIQWKSGNSFGNYTFNLSSRSFANYFGLINIAGYVKYFPYPVVSGFMSGVGLIIILLQLFPLWDSIRQNQPSQY
jgi:SulP family sulfate permease